MHHQRSTQQLLLRIGTGAGILLLILIGVFVARTIAPNHQQPKPAQAVVVFPIPACNSAAVQEQMKTDPTLNPETITGKVTIPAGEPAIVATVNGVAITAAEFETRVYIAMHHQTAEMTLAQARHDMLYKLIDKVLYRQTEKQLGITIPVQQAQQEAQKQMQIYASMPAGSSARITMDAYLCANGFTPQTYAANPQVIRGYQDALAQGVLLQRGASHILSLPVGGTSPQAAYTQQLEQAAVIHIYIQV